MSRPAKQQTELLRLIEKLRISLGRDPRPHEVRPKFNNNFSQYTGRLRRKGLLEEDPATGPNAILRLTAEGRKFISANPCRCDMCGIRCLAPRCSTCIDRDKP